VAQATRDPTRPDLSRAAALPLGLVWPGRVDPTGPPHGSYALDFGVPADRGDETPLVCILKM
jgi:hypothetical protein